MSNRRRRRSAFYQNKFTAVAVSPGEYVGVSKADSTDPQAVFDAMALGATNISLLDQYWLTYQKHPWVAACVNLIANTIAGDKYDVLARAAAGEQGSDDVAKDERVAMINEFFDQGFVGKKTYRREMFALVVNILIFGPSYWRKKRAGKLCVGLERLDPRCVLPKANEDRTEIVKYLVRKMQPGENGSLVGMPLFENAEKVPPEDILFFTLGGGDQLLGAPSPLEHLDHTIGLDMAIRTQRASFFRNGATMGKIIALKNGRRNDVRELENQIRSSKRGPDNAFKTWVIGGDAQSLIAVRTPASRSTISSKARRSTETRSVPSTTCRPASCSSRPARWAAQAKPKMT